MVESVTFAFVSCQNFADGYFTPYADVAAAADIEAVIHLGDYIYEGRASVVRAHAPRREILTLDEYRIRHGQYKTDPNLQAAHAAHPWLVTWDDHEFKNNYADLDLDPDVPVEAVRARRAAAYRAYWEHMPLARARKPEGPDLQLYRRFHWGKQATFNVLDGRQYRSDQPGACTAASATFRLLPGRPEPDRTMLGAEQREWLLEDLATTKARWNVIAQQTGFAPLNSATDGARALRAGADNWDGYVAERQRILDWIVEQGTPNPVVLTGDSHQHWVRNVPPRLPQLRRPAGGDRVHGHVGLHRRRPGTVDPVRRRSEQSAHPVPEQQPRLRPMHPHAGELDERVPHRRPVGARVADRRRRRPSSSRTDVPEPCRPASSPSYDVARESPERGAGRRHEAQARHVV